MALTLALAAPQAIERVGVTIETPLGVQYDRVPISFVLTTGRSADVNQMVDVTVEFSIADGKFTPATEAIGGASEGTRGLTANGRGVRHQFVWNSFYDMNDRQIYTSKRVVIRISTPRNKSTNRSRGFTVDNTVMATVAGQGPGASVGDGSPALEATFFDLHQIANAPDGSFLVVDAQNHRIRRFTIGGTISTVVGDGLPHYRIPAAAPVSSSGFAPRGVTVDQAGIVFYVSPDSGTVRAVNSLLGMTTIVAGTGSNSSGPDNVPANQSALNAPRSILALPGNVLLVGESVGNRIRRIPYSVDGQGAVTPGIISTVCGRGARGFAGDGGPATQASLDFPLGLVRDDQGRIVFVDQGNQVIRRFTIGGTIDTIAGTPSVAGFSGDGGPALAATFSNPTYIAADVTRNVGTIYVSDTGNHRVRRITADGAIDTVAGDGNIGERGFGGPAVAANVTSPFGIAVDARDGSVIVAEDGTVRCLRFIPDGIIDVVAGASAQATIGDDGPANRATLKLTGALSISADQTGLYIVDTVHFRLRRLDFKTATIKTVAGNGILANAGDGGSAVNASIGVPSRAVQDAAGNIYISERNNGHVVRRVDPRGMISSFAGTGQAGFGGDGGPANRALLNNPAAVAIGPDGDIYIADTANNRIRRVDKTTNIISTVVGTGVRPGAVMDDTAPLETPINAPWSLAFDSKGTLYYSEFTGHRVRGVVAGGHVFTVAGSNEGRLGLNGDNILATRAFLQQPGGIAVDSHGLYIADNGNNRVRLVDANGIIRTIAGNGEQTGGFDGVVATQTTLTGPNGLAVDSRGNIYVGEISGQRVRRFRTR